MSSNKKKEPCTMCDSKEVSTEYRPRRKLSLRTCLRCGNMWYVEPQEKEVNEDGH